MAQIPVVAGGISYSSPSFNPFDTSQAIGGANSGLHFDLPLASVAAFTNTALNFSTENTQGAQGFLSGVMANSQSNVTNVASQSMQYQQDSLSALERIQQGWMGVQRYAIKKNYGMGSADFLTGKASCFITTAVTKAQGKPDDCSELQFLRKFRDDYMLKTSEGKALVKLYYAIAPAIVDGLDKLPTASAAYNWLANNFIHPAIQEISAGNFEKGQGIYSAMVYEAAKLAGVNPADFAKVEKPVVKKLPAPKAEKKPAVKAAVKKEAKPRAKKVAPVVAEEKQEGESEESKPATE